MSIIGIDLGTTNSLVAVWRDGKSELIPNAFGEFFTPSVVSVDGAGTLYIGKTAKERLISHPECTVSVFKRFMGTDKIYNLGGASYTPVELSSLILKKLKEDAEVYLGEAVTEAVISVPAYFNNAQRDDTKQAGQLAGLVVNRIINEPSAAALACQILYPEESTLEMVFDFGGGTLDVSIVDCFENIINVIAVSGDNHLGGYDFDKAIASYFCKQKEIEYETLSEIEKASVLKAAEDCKIALSDDKNVDMTVSLDGKRYTLSMDTEQLIHAATPVFRKVIKPIEDVVYQSSVNWSDVERLVPVGGSCKMPSVRMFLERYLKKEVMDLGEPDTVVALGTGVYAGIMERKEDIRDTVLTDVCPFTLGIGIKDDMMAPMINRNTPLPASRTHSFVTIFDGQKEVYMTVRQGEHPTASKNLLLGELRTKVPKGPAGKEVLDVRFTYDINGILEIDTEVRSTGKKGHLLIVDKRNNMTKEQIASRLKQLQALKTHPRDKEENIYILNRCEALYEQVNDVIRKFLAYEMGTFKELLEKQDEIRIRNGRDRMEKVLNMAEQTLSPLGLEDEIFGDGEDWLDAAQRELSNSFDFPFNIENEEKEDE